MRLQTTTNYPAGVSILSSKIEHARIGCHIQQTKPFHISAHLFTMATVADREMGAGDWWVPECEDKTSERSIRKVVGHFFLLILLILLIDPYSRFICDSCETNYLYLNK